VCSSDLKVVVAAFAQIVGLGLVKIAGCFSWPL
jgi:hypothetical protein